MKHTLRNGLTVVIREQATAPVVALQLWCKVGSVNETPAEAGYSHFVEHMLFKGTAKRAVGAVAAEIEGAGGEVNAFTSFDQTVYTIAISSRYAELALDVLADVAANSAFDTEEHSREREVILEEIKRSEDNPSSVLYKLLFAEAFHTSPYKNPVIGSTQSIADVTRDQLYAYYRKWYHPNRMVLAVAGDVQADTFLPVIEKSFGGMVSTPKLDDSVVREPQQTSARVFIHPAEVQEAQFMLAYHIPSVEHADTCALDVLSIVYGLGESSRLYHAIKTEKKLVNSISAYAYQPQHQGIFVVSAYLQSRNVAAAVAESLVERDRLLQVLPTAEELRKAKIQIEKDYVYQRETVQGQARKVGYFETMLGDEHYDEQYLRDVERVGVADLVRVVETYLNPSAATLGVLVPKDEANLINQAELKALLNTSRSAATPRRIFSAKTEGVVEKVLLDNGTTLLMKRNTAVPLVSLKRASLGGLRVEIPATNGLSNLVAQSLTTGTTSRGQLEIAEQIEGMGGHIKASAGRNSFSLSMDILSRFFAEGLDIFCDIYDSPSFTEQCVQDERDLILEDIKAQEDNLPQEAFKLMTRTMFTRHPLGMPILGTKEVVEGFTASQVQEFYRTSVLPAHAAIALVGDFDPEVAYRQLNAAFGKSPQIAHKAPAVPSEPTITSPRSAVIYKPKQQAHLAIGFQVPGLLHKDRYVLEVLSNVLSGQSGRLFMKLRDEQGLAYSVTSFLVEGLDAGYFACYIGTSPEKLAQATDGIFAELADIRERGISEEELHRSRSYIVGNYELDLQQNGSQAATMLFDELYGLGYEELSRYPQTIMGITAADVQRVVQSYIDPQRAVTAIVRPGATA